MIDFNGRTYFDPEESKFWEKFLDSLDEAYSFKGTKVNQENLDRFNILSGATQILVNRVKEQDVKYVTHKPSNSVDFAYVDIIRTGRLGDDETEIAFDEKSIPLFIEVLKLADFVSITSNKNFDGSIFSTISLSINNVFEK